MSEKQDEIQTTFNTAINHLSRGYANPDKADLSLLNDPCTLLAPIFKWGDPIIKSVFFIGMGGEAVLGPALGMGGYDVVWDFYHSQITVSAYKGFGVNFAAGVGASLNLYAGWVSGFEDRVSD